MVPTLVPGTVVVAVHARRIRPGDIVVVWHDGLDKVKRVKEVQHNKLFVVGDNLGQSTDSRDFGWIRTEHVMGRVVWPVRRGWRRTSRAQ